MVGSVSAAALAQRAVLAAAPAELLVLRLRLAEIGDAPRDHLAPGEFGLACGLEQLLAVVESKFGKELAIGQLRQALLRSGDADEALDPVIPRREIGVADRPIDPVA